MTPELSALLDRHAVVDVVIGFANAFDRQDWGQLRSYLMPRVWADYSEFRGEPPAEVAADDYVAARERGLAGLRTVHLSTNHQVRIDGDRAACWSAYQIYRVDLRLPDDANQLHTVGHYEHGLVRADGAWRIDRIRQTVVVRTGVAHVHGAFRKAPADTSAR